MAKCSRGDGVVKVEGAISADDLDDIIAHGTWLLDSGPSEVTLDLEAANPVDSSFIGVIAQLGSDARAKSKKLVVQASGRAADMLSWAGLHRLVTLHISHAPVGAAVAASAR